MANTNNSAQFSVRGSFQYVRGGSTVNQPAGCGPGPIIYQVSGSGNGVASKSFSPGATIIIPAAGTYTLDLSSFNDGLGDPATWTNIKTCYIEHSSTSVATKTIEVTGAAANAIPNLRTAGLLAGQNSTPIFDPTGPGLAFTAPASRIVITNNDPANPATVVLFLLGE